AAVQGMLVAIQPGETLPFTVAITAPASAAQLASGIAHVKLGTQVIDLTATVGARYGVLLPPLQDLVVSAGESRTFTVAVSNTGNAPDSINLAPIALPSGWTMSFGPEATATYRFASVSGGSTVTVPATLAVSPDAVGGVPLEISLKATSGGDAAQTSTATFRVTPRAPAPSETDTETGSDGNGTPGPGLILVLAAVGLALAGRRRHL
ncbi:MAG: NEW3 domain-containing protein, partial [Ilumatobacteraceae bacterium]